MFCPTRTGPDGRRSPQSVQSSMKWTQVIMMMMMMMIYIYILRNGDGCGGKKREHEPPRSGDSRGGTCFRNATLFFFFFFFSVEPSGDQVIELQIKTKKKKERGFPGMFHFFFFFWQKKAMNRNRWSDTSWRSQSFLNIIHDERRRTCVCFVFSGDHARLWRMSSVAGPWHCHRKEATSTRGHFVAVGCGCLETVFSVKTWFKFFSLFFFVASSWIAKRQNVRRQSVIGGGPWGWDPPPPDPDPGFPIWQKLNKRTCECVFVYIYIVYSAYHHGGGDDDGGHLP